MGAKYIITYRKLSDMTWCECQSNWYIIHRLQLMWVMLRGANIINVSIRRIKNG